MNLHELLQQSDRPFLSHPQVAKYYPAASIEDSRRRLGRSIERGEGPGVVFGASGTGKSMLLQVLAAQYHQRFDVVLMACAQMHTRRGLLQAIHFELGLDHQQRDEGELRLSLLDHLLSAEPTSRALLLLVDEAQSLPTQLIEEIRILSNLASNGIPRVRVVLAGLPSLEERLTSPELAPFNQRLAARCCLAPFARAESIQYIQAQVAICGADPNQIFAADTWDPLFQVTDGVPRLVNQLSDRAMLLADDRQAPMVTASFVREAWADLQQLPSSSHASTEFSPQKSSQPSVVEFGGLQKSELDESVEFTVDDAASDVAPQRETLAYTVATSVESRTNQSPGFATAAPSRRRPMPWVDEPQQVTSSISQRRPRTHDDCVPVAADPFADQFEEEEIVFDRFSAISEIFHARTPCVDNLRDQTFAERVEEALVESASRSEIRNQDSRVSAAPAAQSSNKRNSPPRTSERHQETIRLAVIGDAELLEPDASPRSGFGSNLSPSPPAVAAQRQVEDPILLIEDEPARTVRPEPGVRREAYRDLFSRLRHGT
jgi:type II secretory pathway predicted ATPase ExeA